MNVFVEELEFECVVQVCDMIIEIEVFFEWCKLFLECVEDVDIYGVYVVGGYVVIIVLVMCGGQVFDWCEFFWEGVGNVVLVWFLGEVLLQIYDCILFVLKEIYLLLLVDDDDVFEEWFLD